MGLSPKSHSSAHVRMGGLGRRRGGGKGGCTHVFFTAPSNALLADLLVLDGRVGVIATTTNLSAAHQQPCVENVGGGEGEDVQRREKLKKKEMEVMRKTTDKGAVRGTVRGPH